MPSKTILLTMLIALMLPISGYAMANSGSITGRVIDNSNKQPLPGANVILVGTEKGAATDDNGYFKIEGIEENIYKLQITYIGYQAHLETDVRVVRSKATFVEDIELMPSSLAGDKVLVTTQIIDEDSQAPVSSYVSTREQIIRTPGAAGDIFRAIESMPGVSTSGGEFSAFSVRGGSPRENIILVDNIPFGKLTHFDGGNEEEAAQGGRFSVFAPGVVEEANFQGGGFSTEQGGKFASLLDLRIREGNHENVTIDGRVDLLGWEANYSGPTYLLDNTSLFLSARHQNFNRILDITGQKDVGSPRFTDIIVKTATQLGARHKISLLAIIAPEEFDRDRDHVFESENFAETRLAHVNEKKVLLGANWRFLTSKSSFWQNTFYYGRVHSKIKFGYATPRFLDQGGPQSPADISERLFFDEKQADNELGLRTAFNYLPSTATTLTLGFDVSRREHELQRRQDGLDTLYIFDKDDFRPNPSQNYIIRRPEAVNTDFDTAKLFMASFLQLSFKPQDQLTVNLGVRHEFNEFNKNQNFSPRGSISYHLDDKTRLSFAGGFYFQEPEIKEFSLALENLRLKNEQSLHAIAGFTRYLSDDLKFTAESYYKKFNDLIVRTDRTNFILSNAGDGHAYGLDFILIKRFVNKFYGQLNYSYAVSKRNDHNGEGEYNSDFNQPHIFAILGGYEFSKEWQISAKWRYATGRPTDAFITHDDVFNEPTAIRYSKEIIRNNAKRLPSFHTLNIRVDYRKQLGRIALVGFVDIVNFYDHLNVTEERFLDLTGEIDDQGFWILPTLGMKLEL